MKTIKVPTGLSEEEFVEFVRDEVRKVGGDPDTLYPIDYEDYNNKAGNHMTYPISSLQPFTVQCTLKYDNYEPDLNG